MAESPEHRFLSEEAIGFFERASETRLFTLLESERKRFDLTCTLMRDWTRPIVGQVLWKHVEGVDKDIRTMLTDNDAELCIYIAADTTKARTLWSDCVRDYHRLLPASSMRRLRTIWIPSDMDLNSTHDRSLVRNLLADDLASDVLLNVVLGNLSSESISLFASSSGTLGLDLAVLHSIAFDGFTNIPRLSERVGRSATAVRERLTRLVGCGYLKLPSVAASYFHATLRGRVFLELARELHANRPGHPELQRILRLLDLTTGDDDSPSELGRATVLRIDDAVESYGVDLSRSDYHRFWESDAWPPKVSRPAGFHDSQ